MNVEQRCEARIDKSIRCNETAKWVVFDKSTGKTTYRCNYSSHLQLILGHTYSIFPLADYTKHGGHDLPCQH